MTAPATVSGPGPGASPTATGRLLDELAGLLLPVVMPLVRRLPAIILVLAALVSLMGILALVGAHRDDAEIRAHSAVATAQVLPGSDFRRTLITFTTSRGDTVLPERGVFYPGGLKAGQAVEVEYDSTNPDRVRVLGRDASVGSLPIGLMLLVTWMIALPVGFSLRGRQLRRIEAAGLEAKAAAVAKVRAAKSATDGPPEGPAEPPPAPARAAADREHPPADHPGTEQPAVAAPAAAAQPAAVRSTAEHPAAEGPASGPAAP